MKIKTRNNLMYFFITIAILCVVWKWINPHLTRFFFIVGMIAVVLALITLIIKPKEEDHASGLKRGYKTTNWDCLALFIHF